MPTTALVVAIWKKYSPAGRALARYTVGYPMTQSRTDSMSPQRVPSCTSTLAPLLSAVTATSLGASSRSRSTASRGGMVLPVQREG